MRSPESIVNISRISEYSTRENVSSRENIAYLNFFKKLIRISSKLSMYRYFALIPSYLTGRKDIEEKGGENLKSNIYKKVTSLNPSRQFPVYV